MPRKKDTEVLTREQILIAALDMIEVTGLDDFSMRQLANQLGVNSKAIYYHVPSKDAIIIGAIELAFNEMRLPEVNEDDDWRENLRAIVAVYHRFAQTHPHLFLFLSTYNDNIPVALTIDEQVAKVLMRAGFTPAITIQIVYMLLANITSAIATQLRGSSGKSNDYDHVHAQFKQLPLQQYPTIRAIADEIMPAQLETDFEFTIDIIIGGLEMLLKKQRNRL
ncbi:MAG: TetR/AcrR family transcriptional regulator [Aggregatilineales bacterium]